VNSERGEAEMKSSGQMLNKMRELKSPEQLQQAKDMLEQQRAKVAEVRKGGMVANLFGRGAAEAIGVERPEELKTQEAFLDEMTKLFNSLHDKADEQHRAALEAAKASKEAANATAAAAGKLGGATPNRTNNPSPAKI